MEYNKDISIGENKWIKWVDFDAEKVNPISIDDLIEPMSRFWKNLEIECLAECCGIEAFSFLPKDIENASKDFNNNELYNLFNKTINKLNNISDEVIVSRLLNQLMNREMFIELLEHIKENINH